LYIRLESQNINKAKVVFRKSAFRPLKVIQCHWCWYQSKGRTWLLISPS